MTMMSPMKVENFVVKRNNMVELTLNPNLQDHNENNYKTNIREGNAT